MNNEMGLIGRKIGMTQIFTDDGDVVPCTVIEAGPNTVLKIKTAEGKDGYTALQLGFGARKATRVNKPEAGQFKAITEIRPRLVREIRVEAATAAEFAAGKVLGAGDVFTAGVKVDVQGVSKGKGFAGVMKRHNFAGFERSHGVHEYFRHGGSIGTRLTPGMTLRGKKMGGHMGDVTTTVQNLVVAKVDTDRNLIYVRGGVPGAPGAWITIRKAVKKNK